MHGSAGGAADSATAADAGVDGGKSAGSTADAATGAPCDLSGNWIAQHITENTALGAKQVATNWNFYQIEQHADRFTIVASFDCGYVVRGTTDVSLSDATLEAMARQASDAVGSQGSFSPTTDGKACQLNFSRLYAIRGANKAKFLDAVWKVGDAPKPLGAFAMPTSAADGMEDWDKDGHEGLTQLTGLGDRYTAQLDWHTFHGRVPQHSAKFGGKGVVTVDYDGHEVVSHQTAAILQTSSVPMSPGYGFLARADSVLVASGAHRELETCKKVQALAIKTFGDPPAP